MFGVKHENKAMGLLHGLIILLYVQYPYMIFVQSEHFDGLWLKVYVYEL